MQHTQNNYPDTDISMVELPTMWVVDVEAPEIGPATTVKAPEKKEQAAMSIAHASQESAAIMAYIRETSADEEEMEEMMRWYGGYYGHC